MKLSEHDLQTPGNNMLLPVLDLLVRKGWPCAKPICTYPAIYFGQGPVQNIDNTWSGKTAKGNNGT